MTKEQEKFLIERKFIDLAKKQIQLEKELERITELIKQLSYLSNDKKLPLEKIDCCISHYYHTKLSAEEIINKVFVEKKKR